jgi:outer membrane protein OmpA-like peptidoglycan-associated protein
VSCRPPLVVRLVAASAIVLGGVAVASAEPLQLGGSIGPRRYSPVAVLGDHEPPSTTLGTNVVLGPRLGVPLVPWLVFEAEVMISPATTEQYDINVFWIEPRAHLRFQLPGRGVRPFFVLGGGAPAGISNGRSVYPSGITGEGYGGAGLAFRPGRGINLRLDLRVSVLPTRADATYKATAEGELTAGIWFDLGRKRAAAPKVVVVATPTDSDGDGVLDPDDACPERPEDADGRDDADGCPDIDDDGDLVLDIADKCDTEPETYNGFEDEDGCPDAVAPDVDGIIGTIEGLNYEPGATTVAETSLPALDLIATVLRKHPANRIVIIGHTDDVEAVAGLPPPGEDEPAPDVEALSLALGQARAEAVKALLVRRGVNKARIVVVSLGASEPVSDDVPRGRSRNRRVEVRLYVPRRDK